MTGDARIWFWGCWAIVALCIAWFGALAIDGDAIWQALGDASHAITFIAIFLAITAVVVSLLFRRFARVRRELMSGRGALARWRVGPELWRAFAGHAEADIRAGHKAILITILGFNVVICAGLAALHPDDAIIFVWISVGIAAVGGFGWLVGRWSSTAQLTYRDGVVIIGNRGMLVNGALHVWDYVGSRLDGIELIETEQPRRLAVTYSFLTRAGRQYETVFAPVPDDGTDLAAVLEAPVRDSGRRRSRRNRGKSAKPAA
ncbi:MAG: hypothetical protein HC909_01125 [Blastochloris sp.]|nr:hypothetical protein [Blastochloris sp.]